MFGVAVVSLLHLERPGIVTYSSKSIALSLYPRCLHDARKPDSPEWVGASKKVNVHGCKTHVPSPPPPKEGSPSPDSRMPTWYRL